MQNNIAEDCFDVLPAVAGFEGASRAWNSPQLAAAKRLVVLDGELVVMRTQRRLRRKWKKPALASLDEIAGGFYVDITKINWIQVMCWKCDTVKQSYEPAAVKLACYFI